jgi:predicted nucleic acid-binding protein
MLKFFMAGGDRKKIVSAIAQIGACSAICRLRKGSRMSLDEASIALRSIAAEAKRMIEQPINPPVLEAASVLVDRHYLRALDAIQLGCAIVARDLLAAPDMRVVSSDKGLLEAAHAEGFDIWNPCD